MKLMELVSASMSEAMRRVVGVVCGVQMVMGTYMGIWRLALIVIREQGQGRAWEVSVVGLVVSRSHFRYHSWCCSRASW